MVCAGHGIDTGREHARRANGLLCRRVLSLPDVKPARGASGTNAPSRLPAHLRSAAVRPFHRRCQRDAACRLRCFDDGANPSASVWGSGSASQPTSSCRRPKATRAPHDPPMRDSRTSVAGNRNPMRSMQGCRGFPACAAGYAVSDSGALQQVGRRLPLTALTGVLAAG